VCVTHPGVGGGTHLRRATFERCLVFVGGIPLGDWGVVLVVCVCVCVGVGRVVLCRCVCVCDLLICLPVYFPLIPCIGAGAREAGAPPVRPYSRRLRRDERRSDYVCQRIDVHARVPARPGAAGVRPSKTMSTSSHQLGPTRLWDGLPPSGEWRGEAAVSWRCMSAVALGGGGPGGVSISSSAAESSPRPVLAIFTMHEGYGVTSDRVTTYANASTCNLEYRPEQPPLVFDLPKRG